MGGGMSSEEADKEDPQTGMTGREKNAVRDTWAIVKQDVKGNGEDLFIKFFQMFPDYQKHFKGFKDLPLSEFRGNAKVLAHATSVLYAITSFVDNLDDVAVLKEMLAKTGRNHKPRGIAIVQFENLAKVIMLLLEEKLGSKFNANARNGWTKVFTVIVSIIKPELEK